MSQFHVYKNIKELLTLRGASQKKGRHPEEQDLGILSDGAVVADETTQTIRWVGKSSELPGEFSQVPETSCPNEVWLPHLVECHTHLVFGGHRHHDYALRCCGKTYQEIAAEGGGILSTMEQTRGALHSDLLERGKEHLEFYQKIGVGVIEIKSGYGLTLESEIKSLECVRALQENFPMLLVPTFLPAHATPPEFKGKTNDYVKVICTEWIPEVAQRKLAKFFDVFIEKDFFDLPQARQLCEAAQEHGFKIKLHTDQFNDIGGTEVGVEVGAQSCDHLDNISDESIKKLSKSNTVAVVCPGASLFTGTPYPPARKLIDQGARLAIATDFNPGTCPSRNLLLMTTLANSAMKMTLPETIIAVTYNAAAAVGLEENYGSIEPSKKFAVARYSIPSYEAIPYGFGELAAL